MKKFESHFYCAEALQERHEVFCGPSLQDVPLVQFTVFIVVFIVYVAVVVVGDDGNEDYG
jgi:hypothetical protein